MKISGKIYNLSRTKFKYTELMYEMYGITKNSELNELDRLILPIINNIFEKANCLQIISVYINESN